MSTTSRHNAAANPARVRIKGSQYPWLFSPPVDVCTFAGSAAISFVLLAAGWQMGWLRDDSPRWLWVTSVLLIDVAHVYATGFRVYFDRRELRRRPWLYALAPLIALLIGLAVYSESKHFFWRGLAYLAVFHFVRQQYGWVALYRCKAGEPGRAGYWIDALAIYWATLYPLVHWHAHLPRQFWWFLAGDFAALPSVAATIAAPIYWSVMGLYAGRSAIRWLKYGQCNPGKDLVVLTTAVCWYVGIITFNSDYAFTVTNVIIHGVPYMVLVYWYRWGPSRGDARRAGGHWLPRITGFLGLIWLLAYVEEMLWDRGVWRENAWLFGAGWEPAPWLWVLVPLLAVPQITHYVLDGFIWRRRSNRGFAAFVDDA